MKTITFRPLRRIKKTGKITVASYMQWRKVKAADYNNFTLIVNEEYKTFPKDELVYDHNGENLFWYNHLNPDTLPKNIMTADSASKVLGVDRSIFDGEEYKISKPIGNGFHWSVRGFDCDGVPVFSHYTTNYLATHYENLSDFEPLTVEMVSMWFGWFLYQLNNASLKK